MRIFAADDEALAREMLTDAIREALPDAEIFDFAKPSQLLEFASNNPPCEIAFLDIHMRGMNGVELAKKLKDINLIHTRCDIEKYKVVFKDYEFLQL